MAFAVRMDPWKRAYADEETRNRLDKAETKREIFLILKEFAEKHGYKVAVMHEA